MSQTFEQELYEAVARAFPGLTVRAMSRLLGKSAGYWSSVTAQDLPLSMDALTHLSDVVESQRILLPLGSRRGCHLENVQQLLCEEISGRLQLLRAYLPAGWGDEISMINTIGTSQRFEEPPLPFILSRY